MTSTFLGTRKIDDPRAPTGSEIVGNAAITVPDATIQLRVDTGLEQRVARADSYVHWRGLQDEIHDAVVKELRTGARTRTGIRRAAPCGSCGFSIRRCAPGSIAPGRTPSKIGSGDNDAPRPHRPHHTVSTSPGQTGSFRSRPHQLIQRARELATVMDLRLDLDRVTTPTVDH